MTTRTPIPHPRTAVAKTQNLLTYSQAFDNAAWTKVNSTITTAATTAPDGSLTGEAIVSNTLSAVAHYIDQGEPASIVKGQYACVSLYAKAGAVNQVAIQADGNQYVGVFTLTGAGSISTSASEWNASIQNVGNGWYHCVGWCVRLNASSFVYISTYTGGVQVYASSDTTSAQIYLWGAQYVQANWAGPYQPTTTGTVNNGLIRNRLLSPRTAPAQNQNLLTNSDDISQAGSWTVSNTTVSANQGTNPITKGTTVAVLTDNGTNGLHIISETISVKATNQNLYTFSVLAKSNTGQWLVVGASGAGGIYFDIINGVIGTNTGTAPAGQSIQSAGNGWFLCSVTFNLSATTVQIGTANANGGISYQGASNLSYYIAHCQLVQSNWSGGYQQTAGAAVNTGNIRRIVGGVLP